MLSKAHTDADKRAADLQADTYQKVYALTPGARATLDLYTGKCDGTGRTLARFTGDAETTTVTATGTADEMVIVRAPARDFEYRANRFNAYILLSSMRAHGVDFALRGACEMWGL